MSWEVVNNMLLWMTILFLLIVMAYFLVRIDKRNPKLHRKFIQGKWQRTGKDPEGNAWYINYTFTGYEFEINAYPTMQTKGKYRIIGEVENLVTLELYDISGDGNTQRHRIQIAVDKIGNKIAIDERIYTRIE